MKLENIGFYTLCDERAKNTNIESPMWRCEILLTDICNFKCPYCRGMKNKGNLDYNYVKKVIDYWCIKTPLKNIRLSGGEPLYYPYLFEIVKYAKSKGIEHIAISTNGSSSLKNYKKLIKYGVNDFSISLDACCSSFGDKMAGDIKGVWNKVVDNIIEISKLTYVTLGMVFIEDTLDTMNDVIEFGSSLGVSDIRVISSAQYNKSFKYLKQIPKDTLNKYPILKYRINNYLNNRDVRGITPKDSNKCAIVIDDSAISGKYHYPCIIYLREGGMPIGVVSKNMRKERVKWFKNHNTHEDLICKQNCLDVCIDYNNKYREYHNEK